MWNTYYTFVAPLVFMSCHGVLKQWCQSDTFLTANRLKRLCKYNLKLKYQSISKSLFQAKELNWQKNYWSYGVSYKALYVAFRGCHNVIILQTILQMPQVRDMTALLNI